MQRDLWDSLRHVMPFYGQFLPTEVKGSCSHAAGDGQRTSDEYLHVAVSAADDLVS